MIDIAYSKFSQPTAKHLEEQGLTIVRSQTVPVVANWGRRTANSILNKDTSLSSDKLQMRIAFHQHGVSVPSYLTFGQAYDSLKNNEGKIFVARSTRHTQGKGLYIIKNTNDLRKALTNRRRPATMIMEWVDKTDEYRVHVFKGKVIRISRKGYEDGTVIGGYMTMKPHPDMPRDELRRQAKLAIEATKLDFGAVDIMVRHGDNWSIEELWVTEVNSSPGLGGSMPKLYADKIKEFRDGQTEDTA